MAKRSIKARLAEIPAWALSLIAAFASWIFLFLLFDETGSRNLSSLFLFTVTFLLITFLTVACFVISRAHPKSFWYSPLICNAFIISSIIFDIPFWTRSLTVWIMLGIGIVGSLIAAIIGARTGRRHKDQAK